MPMSPRLLRPRQTGFDPRSISGLALWLDAADSSTLYTTDAGPVTAVSAPTEISGCVGWWDASDASSITQSGGLVSQWNDKSGNGNHATASGTARPTHTAGGLNGLSVMTFDGTANSMAVAANAAFNSNDLTYFIVFRASSDANKGVYTKISPSAGTSGFAIATRATSPFVWLLAKNSSQAPVLALSSVSPATQARIYSVTSSSTASGFVDGLSASSNSSTADHSLNQTVRIGSREGSEFFGGYIAEIIHFNAALSPADRARVEAYLAAKWGIAGVHAPATATNDPVGAWLDKSGNGRHATQGTAANRPTISATAQNGRRQLAVASSNSALTCPSLSVPAPFSVVAVVQRASRGVGMFAGSSAGSNIQFGDGSSSFSGAFYGAVRVAGAVYGSAPIANGRAQVFVASSAAGSLPASLSMWSDGIGGTASVTFAGTAPNNTLGGDFQVGSTSTSSWGGTVCEMIAYSKTLSTPERQRIERYLASKWGITLAPQVSNADAQDWVNRVYAAGGTVSAATANAVNQFCVDIENAGIRDRFYRLNLFCGNSDANLAAVRTPLFRGPSLTGTQFGNTTDTNVNFVQGDYAETGASGGLIGNGSSKYLATGLPQNFAGNTGHASVYHRGTIATADRVFVRVANATDVVGVDFGTGANAVRNWWGPNSGSGIALAFGTAGGHLIGSRTASNRNDAYRNGVADGFSTANVTMSLSGAPCQFLVFTSGDANGNPQVGTYTAARLQGYSLGASLTASQAAAFSTAMIAFQTALGRN